MAIRVGTCAWHDHQGFYPVGLPAGERLGYYAARFDLVEVDAPYYGLPRPGTVAGWIERTPPGFRMDVKAERRITGHVRGLSLEERLAACREFAQCMAPLAAAERMGCVLLQFPPWTVHAPATLSELQALREALGEFAVSVEMRHRSWYLDGGGELFAALRSMGAAHVVADEPQVGQGSVPWVPEVTARTAVVRLHGRNAQTWYTHGGSSQERFYYLYREEELQDVARRARTLADEAAEVHVLFNNNYGDFALRNALRLKTILGVGPLAEEAGLFDGV